MLACLCGLGGSSSSSSSSANGSATFGFGSGFGFAGNDVELLLCCCCCCCGEGGSAFVSPGLVRLLSSSCAAIMALRGGNSERRSMLPLLCEVSATHSNGRCAFGGIVALLLGGGGSDGFCGDCVPICFCGRVAAYFAGGAVGGCSGGSGEAFLPVGAGPARAITLAAGAPLVSSCLASCGDVWHCTLMLALLDTTGSLLFSWGLGGLAGGDFLSVGVSVSIE